MVTDPSIKKRNTRRRKVNTRKSTSIQKRMTAIVAETESTKMSEKREHMMMTEREIEIQGIREIKTEVKERRKGLIKIDIGKEVGAL